MLAESQVVSLWSLFEGGPTAGGWTLARNIVVSTYQQVGLVPLVGIGVAGVALKQFFTKTWTAFFAPFFERWTAFVGSLARRIASRLHLTTESTKEEAATAVA